MSLTGQDLLAIAKKHPVSVGCALLAVGLAVGTYMRHAHVPVQEQLLAQRATEGERLKENLRNSTLLKEQHDALVAANAEINSRAVRVGNLATNLQYFYKIEADTGIRLVDLRQLTPAAQPGGANAPRYLRVPYALSVQGDFASVLTFVRRLENGSHFCRINSASISGGNDVTLTLNLELLGLP